MYRTSTSLSVLQLRAAILSTVRQFFEAHGYWEVDTPLLSRDVVVDAWIEPFVTQYRTSAGQAGEKLYLQTSPEFHMKRLLASGADAIYQIAHAFRNGEVGKIHNPEFTILEWYKVGDNHFDQMKFTEALVRTVLQTVAKWKAENPDCSNTAATLQLEEQKFVRMSYDQVFERAIGTKVLHLSVAELVELAGDIERTPPPGLKNSDRDGWLNFLLAECVEPTLGKHQPEFLFDYPASQAALACVRPETIPVAERFELYIQGIEICNGYHELTDADELRARIQQQSALRAEAGLQPLPSENYLLQAMDNGLPACAGVAVGLDRLLMLATGATCFDEVVPFPFDRA